jgi:hypothetical protein
MEGKSDSTPLDSSAADGAWDRLDELEATALAVVSTQIALFEAPFRDTYEAGVIVPILRSKGLATIDVRCAALLHRRVLNDLRGVWVLLSRGYTSQAASIAASLYECALGAICLTLSETNVAEFLADPHGELPWSPTAMAKMVVASEGKSAESKDFENGWRALYAHYVWLCQIKHSSRSSVTHDTVASTLAPNQYVVMALPNVREEDVGVKAMVAIISLCRTHECIAAFAKALGFSSELPSDFKFAERFTKARETAWTAYEPFLKQGNPINIGQSRFTKKYPPIG